MKKMLIICIVLLSPMLAYGMKKAMPPITSTTPTASKPFEVANGLKTLAEKRSAEESKPDDAKRRKETTPVTTINPDNATKRITIAFDYCEVLGTFDMTTIRFHPRGKEMDARRKNEVTSKCIILVHAALMRLTHKEYNGELTNNDLIGYFQGFLTSYKKLAENHGLKPINILSEEKEKEVKDRLKALVDEQRKKLDTFAKSIDSL